jgi:hypothetical protein
MIGLRVSLKHSIRPSHRPAGGLAPIAADARLRRNG